jgi:ribose transport system permease protein
LTNGLTLLNVPSFYEQIVTGLVVVIAVAIDQGSKRDWWGLGGGRSKRREEVPAPLPPAAADNAEATVGSRSSE